MSSSPVPTLSPKPVRAWVWLRGNWLNRFLIAVAAPALFFLALEGGLRLLEVGEPTSLFIPDKASGLYRTNPHFTDLFLPEHFDLKPLPIRIQKHKDATTFRVVVLGESAVFGTPEPGFGFVEQLRAQLKSAYPERKVEVINLGITAINSHVIACMAKESMKFTPDLVVIYMGNNEVVGPYGPGSAYLSRMPPLLLIRASVALRQTRTGQLLAKLLRRFSLEKDRPLEWRGMQTFTQNLVRGDDPRLQTVYANFAANLREIVQTASRGGTKVILSTVVANLKDCAPFASEHRLGLAASELAEWQSYYDQGMLAWKRDDPTRARESLKKALGLDPQYSDCSYILGQIEETQGDQEKARRYFIDALHWDALRFRPDPEINRLIREVSREAGSSLTLVDAARILGSDSEAVGPVLSGRESLLEHVHLNWEGNVKMARLLAEAYAQSSSNKPSGHWLDASECADAVGFTDVGHLNVLASLRDLTSVPPFTHQLTFADDQTWQKREVERVRAHLAIPGELRSAGARIESARKRDLENPFLAVRAAEVQFLLGDMTRALQATEQALALAPTAYSLNKKGTILVIQERFKEAEETFMLEREIDPYFFSACNGLGEIWIKTGRVDHGRSFFEELLRKYPWSHGLRLSFADFLLSAGDTATAETQCRLVREQNPADVGALEQLVSLLERSHRHEIAVKLMLEAFPYQRWNYANNVRLASYFDSRHEVAQTALYLEAMSASGPAEPYAEAALAQCFLKLNRREDAIIHVIRARKAAAFNHDARAREAIDRVMTDYGTN